MYQFKFIYAIQYSMPVPEPISSNARSTVQTSYAEFHEIRQTV